MPEPTSSAAPSSVRVCYRHLDTTTGHSCAQCRRPICNACLGVGTDMRPTCPACADSQGRRSQAVMIAAAAAVAVVVAGIGTFIAMQPAPVPYGEHRLEIERLSARIAASPCEGQSTLELVDLLNKERDFPRTVVVVDAFRAACKPVPRLYWSSYAAKMQVQDFAGAVADATLLIADNGSDGDFWWWRAKARRASGDLLGAEADLLRAHELHGDTSFWTALDLASLLEEQHRPCDAVPILALVHRNSSAEAAKVDVGARLSRLIHETPCADITAAMPKRGDVAAPCSTLPSQLQISDELGSGFEFSLKNTWAARTMTVATGEPAVCRAEFEKLDISNTALADTGMQSWAARLACVGRGSVTAQALGAVPLKAQEELVVKLVDAGVRQWCGR